MKLIKAYSSRDSVSHRGGSRGRVPKGRLRGGYEEFEAFVKTCGIRHIRVRAVVSEDKSWRKELPKILMTYRAIPHQISGKSPSMLNHEIRTKVPHVIN